METLQEVSSKKGVKQLSPGLNLNKLKKIRTVTAKMRKRAISKLIEKGINSRAFDQLSFIDVKTYLDKIEQNIYDIAHSKDDYLSLVAAKVDRLNLIAEVRPKFDENFVKYLLKQNFCHPWSIKCPTKNGKRLYYWHSRPSNNNKSILTFGQLFADKTVAVVVERKIREDLCKSLFTTMIDEIEMQMFAIFFDPKSRFDNFLKISQEDLSKKYGKKKDETDAEDEISKESKIDTTIKVIAFDLETLGPNGGFTAKKGERLYQFNLNCDIIAHILFGTEPNTLLFISHCHTCGETSGTMEQFTLVSFDNTQKATIKYSMHFSLGKSFLAPRNFVSFDKGRKLLGFYVPHSIGGQSILSKPDKKLKVLSEQLGFQEYNGAIAIYSIDTSSKPHVERIAFSETDRLTFLKSVLPHVGLPGDLLKDIKASGLESKKTFDTKFHLYSKLFKYYVFIFSDDHLIAVKNYDKYALSGKTPSNKKLCISFDLNECKPNLPSDCVLSVKHCIILTSLYVGFYSAAKTTIFHIEIGPILKDYRKCARCGKLEKKKRKNCHGKRISNFKVCRICKCRNFHLYWRLYPCHYCSLKCIQKDWTKHKKLHIDYPFNRHDVDKINLEEHSAETSS